MGDAVVIGVYDRKQQWKEVAEVIAKAYPSIQRLKWDSVFQQDPVIAGRIINDIIKIGGPPTGKPGKRASLNENEASERFKQIMNEDFSYDPFSEAFAKLCGAKPIRTIAEMTNLDRNMVHKLLRGQREPDLEQIESIAKVFRKAPSFFLEYRILNVAAFVYDVLIRYPESSTIFYSKIVGE